MAGKNAGNFAESAFFCENTFRKHLRIQLFAREFPTRPSREFIRASREFIPPFRREQGIWREIDSCAPFTQLRQRSARQRIRQYSTSVVRLTDPSPYSVDRS